MTNNAARRTSARLVGMSRISPSAALWLAGGGLAAALAIAIFVR